MALGTLQASSEVLPETLNWIEVWRLCWPWHDIDLMVFEPVLGLLACVLWVIVLLENDIVGGQSLVCKVPRKGPVRISQYWTAFMCPSIR